MQRRNVYLNTMPVEEAFTAYYDALKPGLAPCFEHIPVSDALDRITKEAVYAKVCSPAFNAAAMDGIAVESGQTKAAREHKPVVLKPVSGYRVVDTGDPIYPPFDAVIMAEDSIEAEDGGIAIRAAAAPWQHIRAVGEDIAAGDMLIPSKHSVTPMDIGVLLAGGVTEIEVYTKPRVAILPTGTEIAPPGTHTGKEGAIIESNGAMLRAMAAQSGGEGFVFPPLPDDYRLLKEAVHAAVDHHTMVLVIAGSSAGTEDYTASILADIGTVIVHGVAMKPGKPVILAVVDRKPVIGIPGYPVSAYLAFKNFVSPILKILSGVPEEQTEKVRAVISKRIVSSLQHREYVRVKLGKVDRSFTASPLARGAGATMSLVQADGFCVIPQNSEGIEAGETASIELCRPLKTIEHTLVAIGSHDFMLDLINDRMSITGFTLSSTHIGSVSGLMALKRNECHITPLHILDEPTGEYNRVYLEKLFTDEDMLLIKGVGRIQGLMIQKGNPLAIKDITDILRCRYINRQRGAGTRIFLDYLLKKAGISSGDINGYTREAATHSAVAAAIASGSAELGMGVMQAASSMNLDFIPLGTEEYDFAMHPRHLELPQTIAFLDVLRSDTFKQNLADTGAYTARRCGEIVPIKEPYHDTGNGIKKVYP